MTRSLILIAHNLRSTHNVGSILRTCDGLGVDKVFLTGYTPYPAGSKDDRLPHLAAKISVQIKKTALGAEESVAWQHVKDLAALIPKLKNRGYQIVALEQSDKSINLSNFKPIGKVALIVGREVEGIETDIMAMADRIVEIGMCGKKESFNVAVAAGIALYQIKNAR